MQASITPLPVKAENIPRELKNLNQWLVWRYQTRDGKHRWVIYNGESEASRVSADWHGWLHFTWDQPPTEAPLKHKAWEQPHQENLTGTLAAFAPAGSIRKGAPVERRDYEAWQPE